MVVVEIFLNRKYIPVGNIILENAYFSIFQGPWRKNNQRRLTKLEINFAVPGIKIKKGQILKNIF